MSPSMPASGSETAYDSRQYSLNYAPGVERHFWSYARNRIIERLLRRYFANISGGAKLVLDVGCGPESSLTIFGAPASTAAASK